MVAILNRQRRYPVRGARFRELLRGLAHRHRLPEAEVALAFVGEQAVRTLNRLFRKKDEPTDVLSFPIRRTAADGRFYLGDIIIAVPVSACQARARGHSLEREMMLLASHGFLHLLGYDHGRAMDAEEAEIRRLFLGD
ncbi:MAG: rRNA maturation RNase YbeY [Candidatus Aminicenantes bacterium]|nr:rRNA maturation RNase YbeY [Candidatus Aminicenantes bacterium]